MCLRQEVLDCEEISRSLLCSAYCFRSILYYRRREERFFMNSVTKEEFISGLGITRSQLVRKNDNSFTTLEWLLDAAWESGHFAGYVDGYNERQRDEAELD